jgi:hypothetical protein
MSRRLALATSLFVLATLPAAAAPRIQAAYLLDLETHQERDDEALSGLQLELSDDYAARRLRMDYDLVGRYRYDHVDDRDNSQWNGSGALDYRFSRSLSALLNLDLSEVADPGVLIEDELDTQTLVDGRAGLQWRLSGIGRSEWSALLQRQVFRYQSSSDLDADEDRVDLGYRYRLSERASFSLGYSRFDQRYREASQSILDTENSQWQLGYDKRWARVDLQLFANSREVEFDDGGSDRFEGYGIELSHRPNSRNRLSLRLSRDLEQAFRFNTRLGNGLDRLEQAGLVDTDSLRLSWDYRGRFTQMNLSLYQDDFDIINGAAAGPGRQRGGELTLLREFNQRFSARLSATALDNDLADSETRLTELSLIYQWLRSRRFDLRVELQSRAGEEAGEDADDVSLVLRGRANLIP